MTSFLTIRNVRYAFDETGAGPLVLFGHGLYFDRSMFAAQARLLSSSFRCVCLDWPGHGQSGWRADGWAVDDLVEDVVALIDALGGGPAILVGLSQGGAVFTRVALARPDLVRALVVMDAAPHAPAAEASERMKQNAHLLATGGVQGREQFFASLTQRVFSQRTRREQPDVIAHAMQIFRRHDPTGLALAATLGLTCESIADRLSRLGMPTMLLWGRDDVASPIALAEEYREQIDGLVFLPIDDAGHSVPLEQPERVSAALAQFLATRVHDSSSATAASDRSTPLVPRAPVEAKSFSPVMFAHFVVQTAKYEAMKRWYLTVLSARVAHEGHGLCFITYDDEHHRIAIKEDLALVQPTNRSWGMHHLAYTFASLDQLLSTYVRLRRENILPYWTINHGPTTSLYYRDPDGTQIELQVDNLSKEEAEHYLLSEEFDANPIGVVFDPEQLIRDYESGVVESELLRRPSLPPGKSVNDMRPGRS